MTITKIILIYSAVLIIAVIDILRAAKKSDKAITMATIRSLILVAIAIAYCVYKSQE